MGFTNTVASVRYCVQQYRASLSGLVAEGEGRMLLAPAVWGMALAACELALAACNLARSRAAQLAGEDFSCRMKLSSCRLVRTCSVKGKNRLDFGFRPR